MIYQNNAKINDWLHNGEIIYKVMGAGSIVYQRLVDSLEPTIIYRWVLVDGEYLCDGTTKVQKLKEQYSDDNGSHWFDVYPYVYKKGDVIEYNSEDCGYIPPTPTIYRWIQTDETSCEYEPDPPTPTIYRWVKTDETTCVEE